MTTTKIVKSLLIAALLASATGHAADQMTEMALEDGKHAASFKIGDMK